MEVRFFPKDRTITLVPEPLRNALLKGLRNTRGKLTAPGTQDYAEIFIEEIWHLMQEMLVRNTRGMSQTTMTHLARMIQERPFLEKLSPSRAAVVLIDRWTRLIEDPDFALSGVVRLLIALVLQSEPVATLSLIGIPDGLEEDVANPCSPKYLQPAVSLEEPELPQTTEDTEMVIDIPQDIVNGDRWW